MPQTSRSRLLLLLFFFSAGLFSPPSLVADDDPPADDPPAAEDAEGKPLERLIYVPYRDLKKVLGTVDRTVFVPYSEYRELVRQAEAAVQKRAGEPQGVLSSAGYVGKVAEDHVRITATYTVEALDGPWAEVPLEFGNATVGKVTTPEGKPEVLLRGRGPGKYAFVLPTKGTHVVQLELLARVRRSPDGRGFEIGVPSAGIATLELEVPKADQVVRVEPDLVVLPAEEEEAAPEAESTRVTVNLGSTTDVKVRWSPKAGVEPDMDLLASAENGLEVRLADRLVNTRARLTYRVLRGEQTSARIAVPKGHRVLDVASPDIELRGWATEDEENRSVVTAEFLAPTRKPFTIEVRTEGPLPEDVFAVAGLAEDGTAYAPHALDVVRESGFLVVVPERETTLSVEESTGVVRIEATEVPESLRAVKGSQFRFFDSDFDLQVLSKAIAPRIVVATETSIQLLEDRIDTAARFDTTVERAGVFELVYRLPAGDELVEVVCDGMREHVFDEATGTLRIALRDRMQGRVVAGIRTRRPFEATESYDELSLPTPEPVGVDQETGVVRLSAITGIAVRVDEANTSGLTPDAAAGGGATTVGRWTFTRRPFEVVVSALPRPTRLTAEVGTTVSVKRESARVVTRLNYTVEYAGVDEFRFSAPESLVESLAVTDSDREPVDFKPEAPVAGWVPVRIRLPQKVTGRQTFLVEYDLPPGLDAVVAPPRAEAAGGDAAADADAEAAEGEDEEPNDEQPAEDADEEPVPEPKPVDPPAVDGDLFVLQPVRALGNGGDVELAEVRGEITVVRERMLSVNGRVEGPDAEGIDVRELRFHSAGEAFLAYRYADQDVRLELGSRVNDVEDVLATVVSRALVEVVVGRDEFATYRCRYRIVSSERQRLSIELPLNANVHGIRLDEPSGSNELELQKDESAKPEDGFEAYTVDVARTAGSEVPFHLTILFHWSLEPKPFEGRGGRLQLNLPRIGGETAGTQQTRTIVWIPEGYAAVGSPKHFVAETSTYLGPRGLFGPLTTYTRTQDTEAWIDGGASTGVYELATVGRPFEYTGMGGPKDITVQWWDLPFVAWVIGVAVAVIALLLRNTPLRNKLTVLVVVAAALGAYALRDPDTALLLVYSARFGLAVLVVVWVLAEVAAVLTATGWWPPKVSGPKKGMAVAGGPPEGTGPATDSGPSDSPAG